MLQRDDRWARSRKGGNVDDKDESKRPDRLSNGLLLRKIERKHWFNKIMIILIKLLSKERGFHKI